MSSTELARIQSRTGFAELRRPSGEGRSGPVRVRHVAPRVPGGEGRAEVAYALGRSFGPAVRRNRGRRRLRAAVLAVVPGLPAGRYLLSATPAVADLGFDALVGAVRDAMMAAATATSRSARTSPPSAGGAR